MTARNVWDTVRPYLGIFLILSAVVLFGWEVYGRVVHVPHLWGYFALGMFGAWLADSPGTQGFVTMILKVVPFTGRGDRQTDERRIQPGTVEVRIPTQASPKDEERKS